MTNNGNATASPERKTTARGQRAPKGVLRRLLRTLLLWVPATVAVVAGFADAFEPDATIGGVIAGALATAAMTAVQICFWTTLVFAFIERASTDTEPGWDPDTLPAVPDERRGITLSDAIAGATFNVALAALLAAQHDVTRVLGDSVPLLDPDLWSFWLPFLIAVALASAALEVWKYRRGWTMGVLAGAVATSLAFAGPVAWLAKEERLLNPDFVDAVGMGAGTLSTISTAVAVGAVLVAVWEIGEAAFHVLGDRVRTTPRA